MEKMYTPIDVPYTGRHKVYRPGETFPESEIFSNLDIDLNGSKEVKDEKGNIVQGPRAPRIKLVSKEEAEAKKAGKK